MTTKAQPMVFEDIACPHCTKETTALVLFDGRQAAMILAEDKDDAAERLRGEMERLGEHDELGVRKRATRRRKDDGKGQEDD